VEIENECYNDYVVEKETLESANYCIVSLLSMAEVIICVSLLFDIDSLSVFKETLSTSEICQ
jgi:hypothetical protein